MTYFNAERDTIRGFSVAELSSQYVTSGNMSSGLGALTAGSRKSVDDVRRSLQLVLLEHTAIKGVSKLIDIIAIGPLNQAVVQTFELRGHPKIVAESIARHDRLVERMESGEPGVKKRIQRNAWAISQLPGLATQKKEHIENVNKLVEDIKDSAKKTGIGLGVVATVAGIAYLALLFKRR